MRRHLKRILKEVSEGAREYASRHKKIIGGLGMAGVAGAAGYEPLVDITRRGIGLGRKALKVDAAIDNAAGEDTPSVPVYGAYTGMYPGMGVYKK